MDAGFGGPLFDDVFALQGEHEIRTFATFTYTGRHGLPCRAAGAKTVPGVLPCPCIAVLAASGLPAPLPIGIVVHIRDHGEPIGFASREADLACLRNRDGERSLVVGTLKIVALCGEIT